MEVYKKGLSIYLSLWINDYDNRKGSGKELFRTGSGSSPALTDLLWDNQDFKYELDLQNK